MSQELHDLRNLRMDFVKRVKAIGNETGALSTPWRRPNVERMIGTEFSALSLACFGYDSQAEPVGVGPAL